MLPHFRRIARKIFGYKQQKAHKKTPPHPKHRLPPFMLALYTANSANKYAATIFPFAPQGLSHPRPLFCAPVFPSQTAYSTIHPSNMAPPYLPRKGFPIHTPLFLLLLVYSLTKYAFQSFCQQATLAVACPRFAGHTHPASTPYLCLPLDCRIRRINAPLSQ